MINLLHSSNPWKTKYEVLIIPKKKYLLINYPVPKNPTTKETYWKPGGYPENLDGTYQEWTANNPPKSSDN
jgi:hypothetical protein